ncbi:biotin-dependent carboxyltransferase family protein [Nocardioides cavernaquae]|uniref:Biotin-dependent carboxyltransferase family protein n=1 Tax=Nocardioides cavernaquae TaxID=2321396 RepID=A0A3A5HH63_9ACTN|nr:biotin-dependent carboxyltransferase family protein [Nocardioides cavernaquae]RJS47027.1 biotin-dependent carboxyltransferase family protein [Nocardioides cavernaquae]
MTLTIIDAGALTTVQDLGRPGHAHLGVPRAGALDAPAAALGNRIVGNPPSAAVLETTVSGCTLRSQTGHWIAVTGAPCHLSVDGHQAAFAAPVWVAPGATLVVGPATSGVRTYVAVAGGIAVAPVLGSRSTDTLAGVGPPLALAGMDLPIGVPTREPQAHDTPRPPAAGPLRLLPGPRADWFTDPLGHLCATSYAVGEASNRIGLRLHGAPLPRVRAGELASEGMVLGAVQVPPDGQPVVFLADHPVTGGYPVAAVVHPDDLHRCAQLRPGEQVRFRRA